MIRDNTLYQYTSEWIHNNGSFYIIDNLNVLIHKKIKKVKMAAHTCNNRYNVQVVQAFHRKLINVNCEVIYGMFCNS